MNEIIKMATITILFFIFCLALFIFEVVQSEKRDEKEFEETNGKLLIKQNVPFAFIEDKEKIKMKKRKSV